ncbi:MFS transporter [Paenibacillus sp. J31TS4]|uniref:MFS transporter n=1 Tax=Paenibacillus sp. J31TS4 TaxID=2807195 RepID=UPI001B25A51B|nr:MFS transporter [Paenibacillus sp. J31TS4]GIP37140.1 MFS transporter [Paenibacillus sp. J31TS4]
MLQNPYVRIILCSRALLQLGIWVRNLAILFYVTDLTGNDPLYVSLISIVEYAPLFVFAWIGGTFADRWRPKRTMVLCDALSAVSVVLVLLAVGAGAWYALLAGTFVSASLSQFSQPSALKLYKNHVAPEQLQGLMALSQSLVAIFTVLGPVIGSFVFLQAGIRVSLCMTAVLFLASSLMLSRLPRDERKREEERSTTFREELKEGLRYLWTSRSLRTVSATFAVTGLAAGLIQPLGLYIVIDKLGQGKPFLQWFMLVNGAAMLLGGILIMGQAKKLKPQTLLAAGLMVSAFSTFLVGFSTSVLLTMVLQFLGGLFYPAIQIGIQTLIMRNTEPAYIGRVGGAITPVFMGTMVLGIGAAGFVKDLLPLAAIYAGSAALLVLGVLLLLPLLQREKPAVLSS